MQHRSVAAFFGVRCLSSSAPSELVVYEEGNHVCFNISYKFRPLTGDWMAKQLAA